MLGISAAICEQMNLWERVVFALVGIAVQGALLGALMVFSADDSGSNSAKE